MTQPKIGSKEAASSLSMTAIQKFQMALAITI